MNRSIDITNLVYTGSPILPDFGQFLTSFEDKQFKRDDQTDLGFGSQLNQSYRPIRSDFINHGKNKSQWGDDLINWTSYL